jgi:3'(2'), 5'-bisphosphate nucleotidase
MPLGGAYEVQVSGCPSPADAAMCESAEAAHGDRGTTQRVFTSLRLRRDFVRLDGQCKHGVVGAGAAEINIRLPPAGYREKIWDHAAGEVFITEAGGTVTDLSGKPLNFAHGRLLDASVTGILSSNGVLHDEFLRSVVAAKTIEDAEVAAGKKSRPASMN